jgi:hypothetical protein
MDLRGAMAPSDSDRVREAGGGKAEELRRERRSQVRGLLLLAVAAIVFGIVRAGVHRVFTVGWWRLW